MIRSLVRLHPGTLPSRPVLAVALALAVLVPVGPGAAEPDDCDLAAPRRLSHVEYVNTLQDLVEPYLAELPAGVELPSEPIRLAADPTFLGFENNRRLLNSSPLLVEQYDNTARNLAGDLAPYLGARHPCVRSRPSPGEACAAEVFDALAPRALRRPVRAEERTRYLGLFERIAAIDGFEAGLVAMLRLLLQAPDLLYRMETACDPESRSYATASRLSYLLRASMPDHELFAAAASGSLLQREGVEAQARRLLRAPRARAAVIDFHRQWLGLDRLADVNRDAEAYPGFNAALARSMRVEVERFVEHAVFSDRGGLGMLLAGNSAFPDRALAGVYGLPAPERDFEPVAANPARRAGLLTLPGLLTLRAHSVHPSPVQRGVFILERLLCADVEPPKAETDLTPPSPADLPAPSTNRRRYEERTSDDDCMVCHEDINPLGFAFEHYDSVGAWRDLDHGLPVVAAVSVRAGPFVGEFAGPVPMIRALSEHPAVRRCYAVQWFRYGLGRSEAAADAPVIDRLDAVLAGSDGSILELLAALAVETSGAQR